MLLVGLSQSDLLQEGQRLGHLQVVRRLAQGGMGEVYLARDLELGRKVALKLVRREMLNDAALERFREEARTTARFSHPNIVTVYGVGEHQGHPYVVLEFLEGPTLRERMSLRGRMAPFAAARIGLALAQALSEAHQHGIVHRDLKPENVLLPLDGRPRVVDFGLAVAPSAEQDLAGTPLYMAPEQWLGGPVTGATDVWALGTILCELIHARRPFEAQTSSQLQVLVCDATPAVIPSIPGLDELAALIGRCLDKTAARRPPAAEVASALERVLDQRLSRMRDAMPYRGLLAFGEDHAALFFGRDAELAYAEEQLRTHPVVVIAGPSGAGKSSFVQAGVLPRLKEAGPWTVISVRPGNDPFGALAAPLATIDLAAQALASTHSTSVGETPQRPSQPAPPADPQTIARELRAAPARLGLLLSSMAEVNRERIVLFVDQLEEVATQADSAETRAAFLQSLLLAADDPSGPVRVVATVRDDFLASLDRDAQGGLFSSKVVVLGTPPPAALEEILTRPLQGTGFSFEDPALVTEMARAVEGSSGALPLLSFTASALWDRRDRQARTLTRAAYAEVGGVVGALAEHADRTVTSLGPDRLATTRELFLRMVGADGTRRTLSRARLLEGLPADATSILQQLVDSRLVVSTGRDRGHDSLEIVHEALAARWERLQHWVVDRREGRSKLEEVSLAAQRWLQGGKRDEDLWDGLSLQIAQDTLARTRLPIPEVAQRFVTVGLQRASRRLQLAELRREQKRMAMVLAWLKVLAASSFLVDGLLRAGADTSLALRVVGIGISVALLVVCYRSERARHWIWYSLPLVDLPLMIAEAVNFWRHTEAKAAAALDSRVFIMLLLIGSTFSLRIPVIAITGLAGAISLSLARWFVVGPDIGYVISTFVLMGVGSVALSMVVRQLGVILAANRSPQVSTTEAAADAPVVSLPSASAPSSATGVAGELGR